MEKRLKILIDIFEKTKTKNGKMNTNKFLKELEKIDFNPFEIFYWCKNEKEIIACLRDKIFEKPYCKFCKSDIKFSDGRFNDICNNKNCIVKKAEETTLKKYGVKNIAKLEGHNSFKDNNPMKNKKIVEKVKKTKEKKIKEGLLQNWNNSEKAKKTRMKKYGRYYVNGEKANKTKLERDVFKNGYKYKEVEINGKKLKLQGYEPQVVEYLLLKGYKNIKKCDFFINYTHNGKKKNYLPDLIADDEIIEVKSPYTLKKDFEINFLKFQEAFKRNFRIIVFDEKKFYEIKSMQQFLLFRRLFQKEKFINYYDLKDIFEDDEISQLWHFIQRNFKYKIKKDEYVFIKNNKKYKNNVLYYSLDEIFNLIKAKFEKHPTQNQKISKIFKKFLFFFQNFYNYQIPKPKYLRKLWRVWYYMKKKKHQLSEVFGEYLSLKEMKSKKLKDFEIKYSKELNILKELDKMFSEIKTMDDMKNILSCPGYDKKLSEIISKNYL